MDIILDENISMADKYRYFTQKAPYGLSDKLVDLYLYVANKTGKISIIFIDKEKEKFISLDDKVLKNLSS